MKYFIANWKANKNLSQTQDYINKFLEIVGMLEQSKVIICPPYPLISSIKEKIAGKNNLYVGSQDLSVFEEGSYTGEVTAKTLQGLVDFVILGHSERRKNFNETQETIAKKVTLAKKYQIEPIICIRNIEDWQAIRDQAKIVAYEPVAAIGTGMNEDPKKVTDFKKTLNLKPETVFIYGGSVKSDNANSYLGTKEIDGFLIGGASLDPENFKKIIELA